MDAHYKQAPERFGLVPAETAATMSGLEFLQGMMAGRLPGPPIMQLIGFDLVEVEPERAVFEGTPALRHYNPLGTVHGGYAATLLDSCMGCAVHTTLPKGTGYTTLEFKISLVRPLTVLVVQKRPSGSIDASWLRLGGRGSSFFRGCRLFGLEALLMRTPANSGRP
jgi:acyl-coenzyme A thioesterase PaaI-like protein